MLRNLIVALVLVSCQVLGAPTHENKLDISGLDGYYVRGGMKELSDFLEKNTKSTEPSDNFKLTHEHYESELKAGADPQSEKMAAMRLFMSLEDLTSEASRCDSKENLKILDENDRAINSKAYTTENKPRVVSVFTQVASEFSQRCQKVFEAAFQGIESVMEELYPAVNDKVAEFQDKLVVEFSSDKFDVNVGKSEVERYNNIITWAVDPLGALLSPEHSYKTLKTLTKDDPNKKYLEPVSQKGSKVVYNDEEVKKLFYTYLVDPSKQYDNLVYDGLFQYQEVVGKFAPLDESNPEFYKTWVKVRLNKNFFARTDEVFKKLLTYLYQQKH